MGQMIPKIIYRAPSDYQNIPQKIFVSTNTNRMLMRGNRLLYNNSNPYQFSFYCQFFFVRQIFLYMRNTVCL